jgi:hypothetical protein
MALTVDLEFSVRSQIKQHEHSIVSVSVQFSKLPVYYYSSQCGTSHLLSFPKSYSCRDEVNNYLSRVSNVTTKRTRILQIV